MKPIEAMVLLFCAIVGVVLAGRRLRLPYPIALVIGGLGISLIPGLPVIHIKPDLVFLVFLPPLLFAAAWFTSWHEFKANLRPIFLLAVGLVLFTTLVVGVVIHAIIPGIPLAVAFAFGAIVSPPDAVAATAIAEQMHLPKRIVTVLEGESLVNDATGLVALRFALAAAASGSFSLGQAALEFVWVAAGGLAFGLLVGILAARLISLLKEDLLVITVTLLVPYAAYLPAERLHVSGVLAAVAAGIYGGWKNPEFLSASARLNGGAVWSLLVFLLNCVLFIVIGLELPEVCGSLKDYSMRQLVAYGAIASGVVILIRPIWVYPAAWLPRWLSRKLRQRDPIPRWQTLAIVGWSGMRGVVSLAAALALPLRLGERQAFPGRNLLVFLSFCVVLATLVFQGLTLPFLIRWLGISEIPSEREERPARLRLIQAALAHLQSLVEEPSANEAALQHLTGVFQQRLSHFNDDLADTLGWSPDRERWISTRHLWLQTLEVERKELVRLRGEHRIADQLLRQIQHEIDVEEAALRSWAL
jgi:CPA1 family monovalent cation:H+ antiporter